MEMNNFYSIIFVLIRVFSVAVVDVFACMLEWMYVTFEID